MSVTEICLIVIALAAAGVGVVAVVVAIKMVPLIRRFEELATSATRATHRFEGVIEEVHVMVRDVRHVESRVSRAASEILNIVEPSIHTVSSVVGWLRSGLFSLLGQRGSRGRDSLERREDRGPESLRPSREPGEREPS